MKKSEKHSELLNDAQVDELLRRFFAREVPEELRGQGEPGASEPPRLVSSFPEKRSKSSVPTVIAALALLLAVSALWFLNGNGVRKAPEPFPAANDSSRNSGVISVSTRSPGSSPVFSYSLSENVKPVESLRYDTLHGIVEQRTNLNTTNVSFIEPTTGDLLELTLPELVIEVFPIDDLSPAKAAGTKADAPASVKPAESTPVMKLPEEG